MKKDCSYFAALITSHVDNELNPAKTEQVEAHLEACPNCKQQYLNEVQLKKILKEKTPIINAPAYLEPKIQRQLLRDGELPGFWQLVRELFIYRPLAGSAALALFALLVFLPAYQLASRLPVAEQRMADLRGKVICLDCVFAKQYPQSATRHTDIHRTGIKTPDDQIWTFLDTSTNQELLHDHTFLSKEVQVSGVLFQKAHYVYVQSYRLL
jgi:anti-sigma factor (TIGR02949 family)